MDAKIQSRKATVQSRSQRPEPDSKSMQIDNIVSVFLRYLSSEGSYNLLIPTVDVDVPRADSTPPSPSPPESFHIEVGPSTANPPVASSMSGQTQGSPVAIRCHLSDAERTLKSQTSEAISRHGFRAECLSLIEENCLLHLSLSFPVTVPLLV